MIPTDTELAAMLAAEGKSEEEIEAVIAERHERNARAQERYEISIGKRMSGQRR